MAATQFAIGSIVLSDTAKAKTREVVGKFASMLDSRPATVAEILVNAEAEKNPHLSVIAALLANAHTLLDMRLTQNRDLIENAITVYNIASSQIRSNKDTEKAGWSWGLIEACVVNLATGETVAYFGANQPKADGTTGDNWLNSKRLSKLCAQTPDQPLMVVFSPEKIDRLRKADSAWQANQSAN